MEVDWVVFDAVGTVIRPEPSIAVAYHTIGRQFGSDRTVDDVRTRFSKAFAETERSDLANESALTTSAAIEEVRWRYVVAGVFPEVGDSEGCFQELHDYFARPSAWRLFEDTEPALQALRDHGVHLAIASNFDHRLHPICDGIPALRLFEKRFVSSELGYRKPSRDFYNTMVSELDSVPERVLMVGDDPANDVEGALAVGLKAVLISRKAAGVDAGGDDTDSSDSRFPEIRTLVDIPGLLA